MILEPNFKKFLVIYVTHFKKIITILSFKKPSDLASSVTSQVLRDLICTIFFTGPSYSYSITVLIFNPMFDMFGTIKALSMPYFGNRINLHKMILIIPDIISMKCSLFQKYSCIRRHQTQAYIISRLVVKGKSKKRMFTTEKK